MVRFEKLWQQRWKLRSLPQTIWFNLKFLPLHQAWKLPIVFYKPRFKNCIGTVAINIEGKIKHAMIVLGRHQVSLYPDTGILIENRGHIEFQGSCSIGGNSAISLGKNGNVVFGNGFVATASFKLVSYHRVTFHKYVLFGWDCLVMDTDFHALTKVEGGLSKGYAPIEIGAWNWFGNGCRIMKRTCTPEKLTVQAGTTMTGPINVDPYTVVGNDYHIVEKIHGVWRDPFNDMIEYEA